MEATYASKGVAGAGLGLGIAGTALGLLNNNGGLGNLLGGGWGCNGAAMAAMSEKDAKIAQLSAELDTDRKLIQVWDNLNAKQQATALEVATLKGTVAAQGEVLSSITKCVVPISAVCPTPAVATTTTTTT